MKQFRKPAIREFETGAVWCAVRRRKDYLLRLPGILESSSLIGKHPQQAGSERKGLYVMMKNLGGLVAACLSTFTHSSWLPIHGRDFKRKPRYLGQIQLTLLPIQPKHSSITGGRFRDLFEGEIDKVKLHVCTCRYPLRYLPNSKRRQEVYPRSFDLPGHFHEIHCIPSFLVEWLKIFSRLLLVYIVMYSCLRCLLSKVYLQ